MTGKRFYCKKDGNNQWTVSDRLNQYSMPITSLEFCSVVANALNGLWEQTVRFEKYNQDYMKENEQLKSRINDLEWILGIRSDITPVYSGDRNFNCCILDLIGNGRQKSVLNYLYNHYRKNDYEIKKFDNILREYEVEYGKYGWEKKK